MRNDRCLINTVPPQLPSPGQRWMRRSGVPTLGGCGLASSWCRESLRRVGQGRGLLPSRLQAGLDRNAAV